MKTNFFFSLFLIFPSLVAASSQIVLISLGVVAECAAEVGEVKSAAAEKVILQFDGETIQPQKLQFHKRDSSAFFVNRSPEQAVSLKVDFNGKGLHCHSRNLALGDDGFLRSIEPIQPRDFAVLCFPVLGTYAFTVTEVAGSKRVFQGEVRVDE